MKTLKKFNLKQGTGAPGSGNPSQHNVVINGRNSDGEWLYHDPQ